MNDNNEDIAKGFKEELDKHGYSFQDAIAKATTQIESVAGWTPWVPELPVEVQGDPTRIDFVLTNGSGNAYLVCECKRSNPALSNWCFAKTWLRSTSSLIHKAFAESISLGPAGRCSTIKELGPTENLYQIAVEVKSGQRGDDNSDGRGQIEKTATQVCRQLNGLVNFFYKYRVLLRGRGSRDIIFVPVVLTTARLWTTTFNLSDADLHSGKLNIDTLPVVETPWLWYQYHQSPGLKHSGPVGHTSERIEDILFYEFVRPIAIVTPKGLEDFLRSPLWSS